MINPRTVLPSLLNRIFNQATVTFSAANQWDLARNLAVLKSLVDSLKYSDLSLAPELISKRFFSQPEKAPCTYVGMYEGPLFSMSVFIMAPNYTMPLHDHPLQYGLLKCVAGQLSVQSYSLDTGNEAPLDMVERLQRLRPSERCPREAQRVLCRREPVTVADSQNSPALLLTPDERNLHQITAIDGPVAFFDILSPPYDTFIEQRPHVKRKCTFFREAPESAAESISVVLEKIAQPLSYFCDHVEYQLSGVE